MDKSKDGELIKRNAKIVSSDNTVVKLNYLISDKGGQGDVYHVTYKGMDYALKWYCKDPSDVVGGVQYKTIINMVKHKPSDDFVWPLFVVYEDHAVDPSVALSDDFVSDQKFGYLMNLLPSGFYEMKDFLRGDDDLNARRFNSYNTLLLAGMNIASCMQTLHLKGLSYKDLNPSNFVINPQTGKVLVVDNDNVSVNGSPCTVLGTPGFMAPEIVRSGYKTLPSIKTDYYSLAIVLYRLFFIDHPMDGKLWKKYPLQDDRVENLLYYIKPVFHNNPNDKSNAPDNDLAPNVLLRWRFFPDEIKDKFISVFTEGIDNPSKRPTELAWITAIFRAREKLLLTGHGEQFVNLNIPASIPDYAICLCINNIRKIPLYPKKAIYECSIDGNTSKYAEQYAGIGFDSEKKYYTVTNLSNHTWQIEYPNRNGAIDFAPGKVFPIVLGTKITFRQSAPKIQGEITKIQ